MAILQEYHCPTTLDAACAYLAQRERTMVPLAGGTLLIGQLETHALLGVDGVVDLRKLGLSFIDVAADRVRIGATTTLTELCEHPVVGTLADSLVRRAAFAEGPVTLRNAATVGGAVAAAEADSELYAALLALNADVVMTDGIHVHHIPLEELAAVNGLITEIRFAPADGATGGHARVARTPADRAIVAALAVVRRDDVRVALCGVAHRPVLAGRPLDPPDDFKGSASYRTEMATLLAARALQEARARAHSA